MISELVMKYIAPEDTNDFLSGEEFEIWGIET